MEPRERFFARLALARKIDHELGPFDPAHLDALAAVDRTAFVRPGDEGRSLDDTPLPLDDEGLATISAPHAYLLSFRLVELGPGDHLLELGSGSGYGAALASRIVGSQGHVDTVEIFPDLAKVARRSLDGIANVTVHEGDAMTITPLWKNVKRIITTFAVDTMPDAWLDAIVPGAILVAPVGPQGKDQRLVKVIKDAAGSIRTTDHGAVRYVRNRSQPMRGPLGGSGA